MVSLEWVVYWSTSSWIFQIPNVQTFLSPGRGSCLPPGASFHFTLARPSMPLRGLVSICIFHQYLDIEDQDLNVLYFILYLISIFTCQQNMFGKNRQIIIKSRVTMTHGLALILSIRCGVTPGESNENPGWYEGKWMSLSLDYDFIVFPGVEWSAEHQHGDGLVPLYCGWILWLLEIWGGKVFPLCGRMIFIM